MRSLPVAVLLSVALAACGASSSGAAADVEGPAHVDGSDAGDVAQDAPDVVVHDVEQDITVADTANDAAPPGEVEVAIDVGPETDALVCEPPTAGAVGPVAALPYAPTPMAGIDAWERAAFDTLRDAVLEDPGVHFVATFDHEANAYVVAGGPPEARSSLSFRRVAEADGVSWEVTAGKVAAIFPSEDPDVLGDYQGLLDAFENPGSADLTAHGYTADDARVGFLPASVQSYPLALERLAALFDALDAPDLAVARFPWAGGGVGTHGGLSVLQSRATLIVSGAGARAGVVIDGAALLADVPPTALAALRAPATGGVGRDGVYDSGLMLQRQDGRVLQEALAEDACERPEHVIIVLFDGLMGSEIAHQVLDAGPDTGSADADVPTFRALAAEGVVYRHGAVANYPSMSGPGHMTAGAGTWSGHHNIIGNAIFQRETQTLANPFELLVDVQAVINDPSGVFALYDAVIDPDVETLAMAAHRALGEWDPVAGTGAYVAVFNEISFVGADIHTLDFLAAGSNPTAVTAIEAALGDNLAVLQVEEVVGDETLAVPTILQLSLVLTDIVGENSGPHSDALRGALEETDDRLAAILDVYAARGVLEDTLVFLVSDHGMELQDPTRAASISAEVAASGVSVMLPQAGLGYLRTLELAATPVGDGTLEVLVTNHDNGAPMPGAEVACEGCETATTGADGRAVVTPPDGPSMVSLQANHAGFNPQQLDVSW